MDLTNSKYYQSPPLFAAQEESQNRASLYGKSNSNPFEDEFTDPLCKLNLKETAEFVKSFPMANSNGNEKRRGILGASVGSITVAPRKMEVAPPTPGRPVFSFSVSRKGSFPSKWDDAEKWLIGTASCHQSPAHHAFDTKPFDSSKSLKHCDGFMQQREIFVEKSRVTEDKVSKETTLNFNDSSDSLGQALTFNGVSVPPPDVLLKDKFTNEEGLFFPNFRCFEPTKEGFLFRNQVGREPMKDAGTEVIHEIKHRDIGTEMTPLGSSTTSRCHTPLKSTSPVRHNTPENRSGPLALITSSTINAADITQLQEHHLAKLQLGSTLFDSLTSNWSSREEEEEEISKSLRHFEVSNVVRRSVSEARTSSVWEEEEKIKYCLRYQREEAKIQAWINLQSARAEAQSRKLEVKIQKMRSDLEEKLIKQMSNVHRKAEEWRAAAQLDHSKQVRKATDRALKTMNRHSSSSSNRNSCGCLPCNDFTSENDET
ncbi:hypothetical protein Nepgr_005683 [Nepenthes gracilis]|uniref:Remorin C-terminal domain-containing protein n=1 Tax=Nepenthes gracilis TaxID=150966 RepID=A0AAD3S3N6_NEPGR|nr:hypothetical protein Nepgr_005683 [Nepenthes gracilis]